MLPTEWGDVLEQSGIDEHAGSWSRLAQCPEQAQAFDMSEHGFGRGCPHCRGVVTNYGTLTCRLLRLSEEVRRVRGHLVGIA